MRLLRCLQYRLCHVPLSASVLSHPPQLFAPLLLAPNEASAVRDPAGIHGDGDWQDRPGDPGRRPHVHARRCQAGTFVRYFLSIADSISEVRIDYALSASYRRFKCLHA